MKGACSDWKEASYIGNDDTITEKEEEIRELAREQVKEKC